MAKIEFRSKKEAVYDWILARILDGELAPNASLVIDDIARQLNISPIPVREALQQLEAEGFVAIKPHTGVTVTDLKPELIYEIFMILETIEIISGRLACANMTPEDLEHTEEFLREMDALLEDPDEWSAANTEFHEWICDCSGVTLINHVLARTLLHWDRLRRHFLDDVFGKRIARAHQDHWEMYAAICDCDPERLEETVRRHNRSALSDYIVHLQSTGVLPEGVQARWLQKAESE